MKKVLIDFCLPVNNNLLRAFVLAAKISTRGPAQTIAPILQKVFQAFPGHLGKVRDERATLAQWCSVWPSTIGIWMQEEACRSIHPPHSRGISGQKFPIAFQFLRCPAREPLLQSWLY